MRNRGIGRARMFMGAILLLAALVTWGIVLMMSPHGETVVHGTQQVRSTIVTFKRNGAIGTLILSALAGWMLFPTRRPKWPIRDWTLVALLAFLVASSTYTLLWLRPAGQQSVNVDENVATADTNMDWNSEASADELNTMNVSAGPQFDPGTIAAPAITKAAQKPTSHARFDDEQQSAAQINVPEQQPDNNLVSTDSGPNAPPSDGTDQNQD